MSELPNGWTATKLKETTLTRKGKKPQQLKVTADTGLVPYLDIRAIETNEIRQFADVRSSRIATKNDVLMVWDGARSGWVGIGKEGAIGSTIMALESLCGDPRYLYYFLQSSFDELNSNTRGTGIPHVDPDIYNGLLVPVAPLNEQRRIVAKLETLLSKVDACQQRLAKLPRLLKRFRQAVLAAACSGRLTADWREENQEIETASALLQRIQEKRLALSRSNKETAQILEAFAQTQVIDSADELPASWNGCQIGLIGTVVNGSTPSRKVAEYWDGGIRWVSSGELRNNQIEETKETISQKGFVNSSVRLLPSGTVLLAMIGEGKTRGQTAILKIEATINQNIAAVILNHGLVSPEYLWRWFQFQYEITRESGSGSGPQALNCQRVRELPFHLPPLAEQQEIVRRVEAFFRLADQLEARYHKAKAHVDKLQQSILAKAFRGELVPQDPQDEPAAALLERIRAERATRQASTAKPSKRAAKTRK